MIAKPEAIRLAESLQAFQAAQQNLPDDLVDRVETELRSLQDEVERLQRIIDSRPAINAGLPQSYIDWSGSIYSMEIARATEQQQ